VQGLKSWSINQSNMMPEEASIMNWGASATQQVYHVECTEQGFCYWLKLKRSVMTTIQKPSIYTTFSKKK